jgi:hypothetical protein
MWRPPPKGTAPFSRRTEAPGVDRFATGVEQTAERRIEQDAHGLRELILDRQRRGERQAARARHGGAPASRAHSALTLRLPHPARRCGAGDREPWEHPV